MPARSIDTATLAFGLVSIPVKIYSTSEPAHEVHFHLIHAGCGERLRQRYACPRHGDVDRDAIAKGYEVSHGNFVELSKDELHAVDAVTSDEIAMREFVSATAIDPIFVERTYYLGPAKGGDRAYGLLRDALVDAGLVGIAVYSARGKQYVVEVRPFEDGLAMHQLRYPDEIKPWSDVAIDHLPEATPAELELAAQVVAQLTHDTFDPRSYKDEVKDRVRKLVARKVKGGQIVAPPEAPKPVVTDLLAALKASLEAPADDHGRRPRRTRRRPHAGRASHRPTRRARAHR